jgi:SAM-dependent methyltransferase
MLTRILSSVGFKRSDLVAFRNLPRFFRDWHRYSERSNGALSIRLRDIYPILIDYDAAAGDTSTYYFYQDLWAARKIYQRRPSSHLDIGSRIDGFVAHLLTFMEVDVLDVRPIESAVPGLRFVQGDATALGEYKDGSIESLSSLHAAEHFGLGRYGDPIDPSGHFRFAAALQRVLAPGGRLYFSVPVGRERVEFNAHRVFAFESVITMFSGLRLVDCALIDDSGGVREVDPTQSICTDLEFGCGLFEFARP